MKQILTILLILSTYNCDAQRTMFGSKNNYVSTNAVTISSLITNGLIFNVDAANTSSYSGAGNVWNDLSGSNNIQFYNSSSYNTSANPVFSSDGNGSLITTGIYGKSISNSGIIGNTPRSIEAWVKFNDVTQNSVISIGGQSSYTLYELMAYSNNAIAHVRGTFTPSTTILSTNTWYHIVIIYDGTTNHFVYVNGVKVGVSSGGQSVTLNTVNSPIYIGAAVISNWGAFDGKIAALRIYNRALSADEVTTNFIALKSRFGL